MMKKIIPVLLFLFFATTTHAQIDSTLLTPFEKSGGKRTATLQECMDYYQLLNSKSFNRFSILTSEVYGETELIIIRNYHPKIRVPENKMLRIFINNGIHAGEPDGVDACMMLVRDICMDKIILNDNVEIDIIPIYNVDGALRRNKTSRANQNGPIEYGFRANSMNLDLNRDFVKQDAPDTKVFYEYFFRSRSPDIFIDTHVSDGADYQHVLTLLATQHNQLGGEMGQYQHDTLVPALYKMMKVKGYDLVPYVNDFNETPDSGWTEFYDTPRFSSGYASMFHTMSLLTETHMLKPFDQRVYATYEFLKTVIEFSKQHQQEIVNHHYKDLKFFSTLKQMPIEWKVDSTKYSWIEFKGYEAGHKPSEISGQPRLYYDRTKPYIRKVKFYDEYIPTKVATVPDAYIIPASYKNLFNKLSFTVNETAEQIMHDTILNVEVYKIENFKTVSKPYEGHYLHYDTKVSVSTKKVFIAAGSFIFKPSKYNTAKFYASVLEPTAPDSYFNWNFFDGILQQKEGYSDYVFEDVAADYLKQHPELRKELEDLKAKDPAFAKDGKAQLDWVYKHSPYYETTVNEYLVYRWNFKK